MSKTILTAEDSTSVRKAVQLTLEQAGYHVVEAFDGLDAFEKIGRQPVDLLLTDLNMPRMDGFTLIQKIRELPAYRFLPILALTTESQAEKKIYGKKIGLTGWIVKPFKPDKLIQVIRKVLRDDTESSDIKGGTP